MTIEGTITAVLESWPLELVVETATGFWHVALRSDTVITANGQPADPHRVGPGMRVTIEGIAAGPDAISASAIDLE